MQLKMISRSVSSRRCPDQAVYRESFVDHACVHAKEVSELVGPPPPQWLVDMFRLSDFAWRQARPSCVLLANVRPEAFPVVENLAHQSIACNQRRDTPLDFARGNRRLVEEWALYMQAGTRQGRDSPCRGTRNLRDRSRRLGMVRKLHWLRRDPGKLPRAARRAGPPKGKVRSPAR